MEQGKSREMLFLHLSGKSSHRVNGNGQQRMIQARDTAPRGPANYGQQTAMPSMHGRPAGDWCGWSWALVLLRAVFQINF